MDVLLYLSLQSYVLLWLLAFFSMREGFTLPALLCDKVLICRSKTAPVCVIGYMRLVVKSEVPVYFTNTSVPLPFSSICWSQCVVTSGSPALSSCSLYPVSHQDVQLPKHVTWTLLSCCLSIVLLYICTFIKASLIIICTLWYSVTGRLLQSNMTVIW